MTYLTQHPFIVVVYLTVALASFLFTLKCVRMDTWRDWFTAIVFTGLLWVIWLAYVVAYNIKHRND